MTEIDRIYVIPLRKEWMKVSRSSRANRSISTIKNFVKRHTKSKVIKISHEVTEAVFKRNIKKPPAKIKVRIRGDENLINVDLFGIERKEIPEKKKHKSLIKRLKDVAEEKKQIS